MKNNGIKLLATMLCVIITGIGASLALKAAVGVGAWDALADTISAIINIKIGTISMVLNISCVVIQLIILKKDFNITHILQIAVAVLLGTVVNFMLYNIYSNFTVSSYFINLLLLVFGIITCSIGVSMAMAINYIKFPLESLCMEIGLRINKSFGFIRQMVDIISIISVIILSFIFKENLTVREGTVIAMLIFGPLLDLFMNIFAPRFKTIGLAH